MSQEPNLESWVRQIECNVITTRFLASRLKILFHLRIFQRFGIEYAKNGVHFFTLRILLVDCSLDNLTPRPSLPGNYFNCECLTDSS